MCISARASIISFLTNLFSCIALVKFGNANLRFYNYIIATFLIFVSLMQLVDFGMWIDLGCKTGFNKLASSAGVILIFLQPLVVVMAYSYFIKSKVGESFYNKNIKSKEGSWFDHININSKGLNFLKVANILYAILLVIALGLFFKKATTTHPELLCTTPVGGNLRWKWFESGIFLLNILGPLFHLGALNIIAINPWSNYIKISLVIFYLMLFGTFILKKYKISELWCYLINFSAFALLIIQKVFPRQLA
jgi:hypothetical protein